MNDFTVTINRNVSIPLSVTLLDELEEIVFKVRGGKYRISWSVTNNLIVQDMKTKRMYRPADKDGYGLRRIKGLGCPITYEMVEL